MEAVLVDSISKKFKLNKKQREINHSHDKYKLAVNKLSFSINKGEVFGLLGPNGSGKTTTLRILASLIKPDCGKVFINGLSVIDDPSLIRNKIGFLTSELKLDGCFSANYLFDFFSSLYDIPSRIVSERKKNIFNLLGINDFCERKIQDLSTGMKQKVSLAISMVNNPEIIIFDEPTNGLDIIASKMVSNFILDLKKEGKTVVLSTHIFSLVESLCDRVGFMMDGSIQSVECVNEILKTQNLEQYFFKKFISDGDYNEKLI